MTDSPKPQGRHFGFHGREKEFAWLRGMFDAVATKGADGKFTGPRMAVIVAESGIGKSRLVQELYIRLTEDPQWDPPEVDYWPDAFGDGGVNLRAVPDMKGHVPKGPPRFAWLGARWQSPDERNALARRSVLPEVRSSVMVHAEILKSHGSAWADAASRVSESVRKEGVGESIGAAADYVGIPFFGLMSKLAKGAKDLVADRMAGPKSFEKVEQDEIKSEVDEVLDCMRLLLNGRGAVPTVLWLDDAQWIDDESQVFLHRLWKEAERRKWPLLVVATHWEREWRELAHEERGAPADDSLRGFVGTSGVEVEVLQTAATAALRGCVLERLPGLTPSQQSLLILKAGGNFLTMMENIGELLRQPANFVDRDLGAALSPAGERKVQKWESQREKRVEQRFGELEPEVQDLLGWSSQLGQRFLRDVVVEFASEAAQLREARGLIERCVDPYVILGAAGEHLREFRDRAFHIVASRHFETYAEEHREVLSGVLRRHLVEWVNNSFDADGNEIWPDEEKGMAAPDRSATGLGQEERRDLLGMAMRELPIPPEPDWTNPEHAAALRAVYLLIITDWRENLWDRVAQLCRPLCEVPFESMPDSAISVGNLEWLLSTAATAGAYQAAERIATAVVVTRRRLAVVGDISKEMTSLATALARLGCLRAIRGDLSGAKEASLEAIVSYRRLSGSEATRGALERLAAALAQYGTLLRECGSTGGAEAAYVESIDVYRRLTEGGGSQEQLAGLAATLGGFGTLLGERGHLGDAEEIQYEEIAINLRLAEERVSSDQLEECADALWRLGTTLQRRGDRGGAEARYTEAINILRCLVELGGTPGRHESLAVALGNLGNLLQARGVIAEAEARYSESYDILGPLVASECTPGRLSSLGLACMRLGLVLETRGDFEGAEARYFESIALFRRVLEYGARPDGFEGLASALLNLGNLFQAQDCLEDAQAIYTECIDAVRKSVLGGDSLFQLETTAKAQMNLGVVLTARGNFAEAELSYLESISAFRRLAGDQANPAPLENLGVALLNLGDLMQIRGKLSAALASYAESQSISLHLLGFGQSVSGLNEWIWRTHVVGSCLVRLERNQEAIELLSSAQPATAKLESFSGGEINFLDTCAAFHETSAKAYAGLGRADEAAVASERAAAVRARIEQVRGGDAS
jgi:tetratricopeptide (TPR) repeat protein